MKPSVISLSTHLSFQHACQLVRLGQGQQIYLLLQQQPTLYTPLERWYLRAAIAYEYAFSSSSLGLHEEKKAWENVSDILQAARKDVLFSGVPGAVHYFENQKGTLRRRRPWMLWLLGNLAAHLGCPSVKFYERALHLLDERRMNIPWLQIQALFDLGRALLRQNLPREALVQFEQAEKLASREPVEHEATLALHTSLAETHRRLAQYLQALSYGKQALQRCPDDACRGEIYALLGQVYAHLGRRDEARDQYRAALSLARTAPERLSALIALLLLCLEEHDMDGAQRYREQALHENQDQIPDELRAKLYQTCGQMAWIQATQATDQPQTALWWETCLAWYHKALSLLPHDPQIRATLTHVLLAMVTQDREVTRFPWWHEAYQMVKPLTS